MWLYNNQLFQIDNIFNKSNEKARLLVYTDVIKFFVAVSWNDDDNLKPIRKYLVNKPHSQRLKHYLDRKIKSNSCKPNKVLKLIKFKKINATFRSQSSQI